MRSVAGSTSYGPLAFLLSGLGWVSISVKHRDVEAKLTCLLSGPLIGRWNFFLERNFPLRPVESRTGNVSVKALSKRVAADQLIMAPIGVR